MTASGGHQFGLTAKQAKAKRFIAEQNGKGISPSIQEITNAVGSKDRRSGFFLVRRLSERGHVMRFLTPEEAAANRPGHIIAIGG